MKLKLLRPSTQDCECKRFSVEFDRLTQQELIEKYQLKEKDYTIELYFDTFKIGYLKTNEILLIKHEPYFEVLRNAEERIILKAFELVSAWAQYLAFLLERPYNFTYRFIGRELLYSYRTTFNRDFMEDSYVDFHDIKNALDLVIEDFVMLRKAVKPDTTLDYSIRWFGKAILSESWSETFLNFYRSIEVITNNEFGKLPLRERISNTLAKHRIDITNDNLKSLMKYRNKLTHGDFKLEFQESFMKFTSSFQEICNLVIKGRLKQDYPDISLKMEYFNQ